MGGWPRAWGRQGLWKGACVERPVSAEALGWDTRVTVAATPTEGRWPGVQPWRCRGRSVAQDKSFHLSVSSRPYLQDGGWQLPSRAAGTVE